MISFIDFYLFNITLAFLIHSTGVFSQVLNYFNVFFHDLNKLALSFFWLETPLPLMQLPTQRQGRMVHSLSPCLPICIHVCLSALVSVYLGIVKLFGFNLCLSL